jgi:hypothetical protein
MKISAWRAQLEPALKRTPVSITVVIEIQEELQRTFQLIPDGPAPLSAFNNLYLTITRKVLREYQTGGFRDPGFIAVLDVQFARRYLNALQSWMQADGQTPDCWATLFEKRQSDGITNMQGMLAGVSSHVNYDLAQALVATFAERGLELGTGGATLSPQHQDYKKINDIFFAEIPDLRRSAYSSRWYVILDVATGKVDDYIDDMAVAAARAIAWRESIRLWALRAAPTEYDGYVRKLDAVVTRINHLIFYSEASGSPA